MSWPDNLVTRSPVRLLADPARVVTQLFVPSQEGFERTESRAGAVVERILALPEDEVQSCLNELLARFEGRHRDLRGTFTRHAAELADRLDADQCLSDERNLLLGAAFTSEYAIEGAALCNPSMVAHPDQSEIASGSLRFVLSVRGIGEGHQSSIGFRTGVINAAGEVVVDDMSPFAATGSITSAPMEAAVFRSELDRVDGAGEAADFVFDSLGDCFSRVELEDRLGTLLTKQRTRGHAQQAIGQIRAIADRSYAIEFDAETALSGRVLRPAMAAESAGVEDARFVRFVDDDGSVTYYASYTAYSGTQIGQQLLETKDFRSFTSMPLVGRAAANKGLALFPRRVNGRFAAMSRADRESNAVAQTDHRLLWTESSPCQQPTEPWEVLQLGNCGPPIETEAGWLVLTHGVGPMRTYRLGAILLDLDDPTRVIGRLRRPLLSPAPDERNGYVPNVVYSCGALAHADTLVVPYGISDAAVGFATVAIAELLAAMMEL